MGLSSSFCLKHRNADDDEKATFFILLLHLQLQQSRTAQHPSFKIPSSQRLLRSYSKSETWNLKFLTKPRSTFPLFVLNSLSLLLLLPLPISLIQVSSAETKKGEGLNPTKRSVEPLFETHAKAFGRSSSTTTSSSLSTLASRSVWFSVKWQPQELPRLSPQS